MNMNSKNNNTMKKSVLTIIIAVMAFSMGYAQQPDGIVSQPTHVVGKRINAEGEVTREFASDFLYLDNGKLSRYEFPEYGITADYQYTGDFLDQENISHEGGHPIFHETNIYTYENEQIKTITHLVGQMGFSQFWVYSYYDDGRLERKDFKEDGDDDYHRHWLYEYENGGRTVVASYYTSWVTQGMLLREKTTKQFDDDYTLVLSNTESYNESGELTSVTQTVYNYTLYGLPETKTTQTLVEGEWRNTSVIRYFYDEEGQITEQLKGIWDDENSDWDYTHKICFEISEQEQTYTVSFYKKNNGEWVWDVFNNQTILFGDVLKPQQRALSYMVFEEMNGYGNINQIEFTMERMNKPIYLFAEEHMGSDINIYPNPAKDQLHTQFSPDVQPVQVELYDLQGRLVRTQRSAFETIDLSRLPAGTYTMRVVMKDGKTYSDKVVKE